MFFCIIQLLLLILVLSFIEEIEITGSCILFVLLRVLGLLFFSGISLYSFGLAIIMGIIDGIIAYFIAKILLFIIRTIGSLGYFLVGLILFILLLIIIF